MSNNTTDKIELLKASTLAIYHTSGSLAAIRHIREEYGIPLADSKTLLDKWLAVTVEPTDREGDYYYTNDDGTPFDSLEQANAIMCHAHVFGEILAFKMKDGSYTGKVERTNAWGVNSDYSYYLTDVERIGDNKPSPPPTEEGEKELKCTPGEIEVCGFHLNEGMANTWPELKGEDLKVNFRIKNGRLLGAMFGFATRRKEAEATAAKIVTSYNCHDDLVKALEAAKKILDASPIQFTDINKQVTEALSKASTK